MNPQEVGWVGEMDWVQTNPALLLAVFAGLLLVGSMILYSGK
jgi:hypothetical protein